MANKPVTLYGGREPEPGTWEQVCEWMSKRGFAEQEDGSWVGIYTDDYWNADGKNDPSDMKRIVNLGNGECSVTKVAQDWTENEDYGFDLPEALMGIALGP